MLRANTVVLVLLLFSISGIAQQVAIKVISFVDSSPIAYAHVVNQSIQKGTITDLEGNAIIRYDTEIDSIQITYVGFKDFSISVDSILQDPVIKLQRRARELNTIVVFGKSTLLYKLIRKCRRKASYSAYPSKIYFQLASYYNNNQIEQLESYYNGKVRGADLEELELYKGRVGLSQVNDISFLSPDASEAFYMHRTFLENEYFPESPLSLSYRDLKKHYSLKLLRRYTDEANHRIYVINFEPKATFTGFEGTVYIDSTKMNLLKIELNALDAMPHPFRAKPEGDKILGTDLNLNKTFTVYQGKNLLQSCDFSYNIYYLNKEKQQYTINTKAIIYAYAFDEKFKLPLFESESIKLNDYQKISLAPFDTLFWKFHDEFRLAASKYRIDRFMNGALVTGNEIYAPLESLNLNRGFFEHPYRIWSKERITFDSTHRKNTDEKRISDPWYRGDLYHLSAKLFVAPLELNNNLGFRTYTVFDPFETYYNLQLDTAAIVFINIYFDIVEVQRRKLDLEITNSSAYVQVKEAYFDNRIRLYYKLKKYLKQVQRGQNTSELINWNNYIKKELGIDNLSYFGFKPAAD